MTQSIRGVNRDCLNLNNVKTPADVDECDRIVKKRKRN